MEQGIFENNTAGKFTYGYGAKPSEVETFFRRHMLERISLLAAESIAGGIQAAAEASISEPSTERTVFDLLVKTAHDPPILGAADHLLYIGRRSSF